MWPFSRKADPANKQLAAVLSQWPAEDVYASIRELDDDTETLRFWLPEFADSVLKALVEQENTTISDFVREFAVVYLYGELTLRRMRAEQTGIYYVAPLVETLEEVGLRPNPDIKFSRRHSTETVPGLGKNICPIKIFLPAKLKQDLQFASKIVKKPLSTLLREALIAHLLGNRLLLQRYADWSTNEARAADDWASGKTKSEHIFEGEPIPEGNAEVLTSWRKRDSF